MHWLEALEEFLRVYVRPYPKVSRTVLSATVETGSPPTQVHCELVGGWLFEERVTPRGNIALHLFPSVD